MRVILPPVLVDGKICRIIAPVPSLLEVQEWMGAFWLPSDVLLSTAAASAPAPLALLHSRGVPRSEHGRWAQQDRGALTEGALIARSIRLHRAGS